MADEARTPDDLAIKKDLGATVRLIAAGVLVLITIALVLVNRGDVRIGWVFGNATTPLALALVITFILGLAVGWLAGFRRRR